MDEQVHLFDVRASNFDKPPAVKFGYRIPSPSPAPRIQPATRYTKGSAWMSCFARGYDDGTVRMWDFRNISVRLSHLVCAVSFDYAHTGYCGKI